MEEVPKKSIVKSVYIATMKESGNRLSYWVTIENMDGKTITPFMSKMFERAEHEAGEWAEFFGLEMVPYVRPEWAKNLPEGENKNDDSEDHRVP